LSSIYIHIPYCKKLCYYCDFHFSLQLNTKAEYISAVCKELRLQKHFFSDTTIHTIYFGGGTPSVLTIHEIETILHTIANIWNISPNAEISFECNPDDITQAYCSALLKLGINRISLGVQSFFDNELKLLNRRHTAEQAISSIQLIQDSGCTNCTIDVIYGLPEQTLESWQNTLEIVRGLEIQHISAYALGVEKKTALHSFVSKGTIILPQEQLVLNQFNYLVNWAHENKFEQYEISNFAKHGFYSQHNSHYWHQKPYLGIGASAHSYDGTFRYWNIAHNAKYIAALSEGYIPREHEKLSPVDRFNEYIMTGLRTQWGISIAQIKNSLTNDYFATFTSQIETFKAQHVIEEKEGIIRITKKGICISDTIISDLFIV